MSTLNCLKKNDHGLPPVWTMGINEHLYHKCAQSGQYLSSSMLREFRDCPAFYREIVAGFVQRRPTDAMRIGRAAHKLIVEGMPAYRGDFIVGGPVNEYTGKYYTGASKAFERWVAENGFDRQSVVTPDEHANLLKMRDAAFRHREIAALLSVGWPERSARAALDCIPCQIRLDWLRPDNVAVDLKTVADITRFEADARRFGYLSQFAFYRDIAREAGAGELEMVAVVVEKKPPFRAGVWRFSDEILQPYSAQNRMDIARLAKCREKNTWPTGYEKSRPFPPAGIPPVWLN